MRKSPSNHNAPIAQQCRNVCLLAVSVSDRPGESIVKPCRRTWLILFPASPNPFPSNTLILPKKYAMATGLKID